MPLRYVDDCTWEQVFAWWRSNEEHLEHWREFYTQQGYSSWEEWRRPKIEKFNCENLDWQIFEIKGVNTILDFHGGPFSGWVKAVYEGRSMPTFREMMDHPWISSQPTVREISENFPEDTILTGLSCSPRGIYVIEGMHRSAAVALAIKEGRDIRSQVMIALAVTPYSKLLDILKLA